MPRDTITPYEAVTGAGLGNVSAGEATHVYTSMNATNKTQCVHTGREQLEFKNTDAENARTITITSVPDRLGRTGDIGPYSIAPGASAIFGPFPKEGWRQENGMLYFEASHASVSCRIQRLPKV